MDPSSKNLDTYPRVPSSNPSIGILISAKSPKLTGVSSNSSGVYFVEELPKFTVICPVLSMAEIVPTVES